jgi:hypothetical protein
VVGSVRLAYMHDSLIKYVIDIEVKGLYYEVEAILGYKGLVSLALLVRY